MFMSLTTANTTTRPEEGNIRIAYIGIIIERCTINKNYKKFCANEMSGSGFKSTNIFNMNSLARFAFFGSPETFFLVFCFTLRNSK